MFAFNFLVNAHFPPNLASKITFSSFSEYVSLVAAENSWFRMLSVNILYRP